MNDGQMLQVSQWQSDSKTDAVHKTALTH